MNLPLEEEPERPFAQMLWSLRRLGWPLLPQDARLARMQEVIDRAAARKAQRVFGFEGVTVTGLGSVPPGPGSAEPLELRSGRAVDEYLYRSGFLSAGRLGWDGQVLTVGTTVAGVLRFRTSETGVLPGFRADEVARDRVRPDSAGLAACPSAVVEIAAVAPEGERMRLLFFLDEASRHLAVASAFGLSEDEVAELARRAGIAFRVYWVSLGPRVPSSRTRLVRDVRFVRGRLAASEVFEAVFPRSARFPEMGFSQFSDESRGR